MTEKERSALFDILGPIEGAHLLDAYAGSGGLGLEALSRGAADVVGIEVSRVAAATIHDNLKVLGLTHKYRLEQMRVEDWVGPKTYFDVILAAPPFAVISQTALEHLTSSLADSGVMVVSHTSQIEPLALKSLELVKSKRYGNAALSFYKPAN